MAKIDKQPLTSMNITEEQLLNFKQLFPEVFTEGLKIDWDKLKLTLGEAVDTGKERYGMNWPGKADCFKTIQQPSIATLVPARDESIDFDTTENLFIEGDNLEVLKLLQKSYLAKVKMIYIDPPYNTGNDFIYPDNYAENLNTYLEYTGQVDSEGRKFGTNTDTDGRFHSKWMNMMYPRLFLAKNLLKEDGIIFISIDDNEVDNLKKICNEIFGEENFVANVIWEKKFAPSNDAKWFSDNHDHILVFSKAKEIWRPILLDRSQETLDRYKNPDNDERGVWVSGDMTVKTYNAQYDYEIITPSGRKVNPPAGICWRFSKEKFNELIDNNRVWFGEKGENVPRLKRFLSEVKEGITPLTIWFHKDVGHNQEATQECRKLFDGKQYFDSPKPSRLLSRITKIGSTSNDIILDFFAGSATTAHAVMELNKEDGGNRKFICVQIPEPTEEKSEAYKAGYKNIAEISKERIRRVSAKLVEAQQAASAKKAGEISFEEPTTNNSSTDIGFKVFKLDHSNFKIWDATLEKEPEAIQQRLFDHIDHISPEAAQESILYELLLKSGFELTTPIEKLTLAEKTVFSIAGGQLLICLEKELSHDCIKAMAEMQPTRVICLDEAFTGVNADSLKTNAVQIMKSKGVVNFRTV
ncbi:MAG: site-specific DNA-methyltransferase [Bacteroidales bacterium]